MNKHTHTCRHCGKPTEFIRRHESREGIFMEVRECKDCCLLFKTFPPRRESASGDHPQAGTEQR